MRYVKRGADLAADWRDKQLRCTTPPMSESYASMPEIPLDDLPTIGMVRDDMRHHHIRHSGSDCILSSVHLIDLTLVASQAHLYHFSLSSVAVARILNRVATHVILTLTGALALMFRTCHHLALNPRTQPPPITSHSNPAHHQPTLCRAVSPTVP